MRQFKPDPYSEIDGECDYGDDDRVKPHSSPEWSGDRSPGETQPVASTLNASDGAIMSNMAIVQTTNGTIDAFSSNSTNLILDLSGYFAP